MPGSGRVAPVTALVRRLRGLIHPASLWDSREPVREELFSIERLEEHGRSLALAQAVTRKPARGHPLTQRLAANGTALLEAYRILVKAADERRAIAPAAEWLIDNYHLVEKQIREIVSDLPPRYYHQLPKLAAGPFAGYPRVFGMAWAFVAHTDSRFDPEMLISYARAYQEVQPLKIGELWALPLTLRMVLIENLRRLAQQMVLDRAARHQADDLADRLLGSSGRNPETVATVLSDFEGVPLADALAVQLVHRLRDHDPKITPALTWLDRHLAAQAMTADTVVRDVHRRQGASNVTVRNIITSLRLIADVDWNELFERISLVDQVLAADSAFMAMDFATRNLYRSAIEVLAKGSAQAELEVARRAVQAARRDHGGDPGDDHAAEAAAGDGRRRDPGYYLLAGGRAAFEREIGFRPRLRQWPAHLNRACGIGGYVAAVALVAALLLALPLLGLAALGIGGPWLGLLGVVGLIPAVDAAVALVNRAVTVGFDATLLPGLELGTGVPAPLRTLVAVPMLLTTREALTEQIERLEIHHLASPDGDLHFALLSDWTDAATEHAPGDQALLAAAVAGIAGLNRRYRPAPSGPRFLLFHRRRQWNPGEARWIGWERKRGKLHELNRLLRGASDTSFMALAEGGPVAPAGIRYVVTLDADTRLPRDTVRRLIGKMAHPLNRPRFDLPSGRVVEGYAVLQPRVTPSLPVGHEGSLFQRIFSSVSGIDPYAAAVSDVYQDLFGEGSYAGKGIYDVDAFEAALAGRVPDSTLLSHDLFEGVFARAGLASDVEVVEEFPARYDVGAQRHHRWARGDWQLLPWILGCGPTPAAATRLSRAIPAIGRWKMLDNLRRTLSAPVAILALLAGWLMPLEAAALWTLFVLSTILMPTLIPVVAAIPASRPGITLASHLRALGSDFRLALTLSGLIITFLAHQAWLMSDAISRTLFRLFVNHRHLLEWVPAAQTSHGPGLGYAGYYRRMVGSPLIGAAALGLAGLAGQGAWPLAALFTLLWAAAPAVACRVSRSPRVTGRVPLPPAEAQALRLTARRTWRYFESFVTLADHWLPPDNFQEDPQPVAAHRTSPTNLGLYLLSVASARDFGWIGTSEATQRLEETLATMGSLARFRGHFFNWYDTRNLQPLEPRYVSSVDSGNLAGHLIALANACREWRTTPLSASIRLAGIADALNLTREEAVRLRDGRRTQTVTWRQLDDVLAALIGVVQQALPADADLAVRLAVLAGQAETMADIACALAIERGDDPGTDLLFWAQACQTAIESHRRDLEPTAAVADRVPAVRLAALEECARSTALAMEFGFLLDRDRKLLSIGYLVPEGTLDPSCYDLLASEARLASFIAIAKGDIPARHWFRLGRAVLPVAHSAALISWSGSMFEYLMPALVMRAPADSLLEQTGRLVVRRQIDYADALDLPWGISESAYNARDLEFTYQYSNFGVPGLGLKRGLGDNLVVAPYATALATMVDPPAAAANLARLAGLGARGRFGFYEALDYTPSRVPEGESMVIIRAFMAHHQGMTIVAMADALFEGVMRSRFHAEPMIQATELLLHERMPRDVSVAHLWEAEVQTGAGSPRDIEISGGRRLTSPHQLTPATHLLSNGRYTTLLTAAGSGYSRWGEVAVSRWQEDATRDDLGSYLYIRDTHSGAVWSAGFQPCGREPDDYQVAFHEDRAEFTRRDGSLTTTLDVLISPEDDAEVRRVSLLNAGSRVRELEITSYSELVLGPQAAALSHPAFAKMFVVTEYLAEFGAIVATRRRRGPDEPELWAAHLAVVDGETVGRPEFETDRARFLGRGQGVRTPLAVSDGRTLSNTVGTVLDPIFALRRRVQVVPGGIVRIAFWTLVASSRPVLIDAIDKHRDATAFARAATLAWTQAQVQLHHLGITAGQAGLFQRLAGHVIFATPALRPSPGTIARGSGAQAGLWALGISGDAPIVLLRIAHTENLDIARELLQAHEYWRLKQLGIDLVILNEHRSSYLQDSQSVLETLVRTSRPRRQAGGDGPSDRVFVLRADLITAETRALLISVARVVIVAHRGSLFDQLERLSEADGPPTGGASSPLLPLRAGANEPSPAPVPLSSLPELEFFNGLGGFGAGGSEYVTILGPGQSTPAPWLNVIANPTFGFQVATEGSGFTWSLNSRDNQLTPWSNDPVSDRSGEAFYLRDDETGALWSPTAQPIRDPAGTYLARHGRGYSRFEHSAHGIAAELLQFVPLDDPIKISRLVLRNPSSRIRYLSVTAYVEWVLGQARSASLPFVITEIEPVTGALLGRNPWDNSFGTRVAFLDLCGRQTDWSGDRREFIGRNGTLAAPAGLARLVPLSNRVGAGLDPCGAVRTRVELLPHASVEIVCFLGQSASVEEVRALIARYRALDLAAVLAAVTRQWDEVLGQVQVKTPERSLDLLLNGWLLYQTLACRMWARCAFYQASGAYGFRDQLQDGLALTAARPDLVRQHLLRAAARQFAEGDVQHWWLPQSGQGVRTRISDDRVWLAYTVAHYVEATGDLPLLDQLLPFLDGPALKEGEADHFFLPTEAKDSSASLFEHCARALDHSLAVGRHGLPLIGSGDWNDGMNRVGERGEGESVWLGWFLFATLNAFAPLAEARLEIARATVWRAHAAGLQAALEREAWDGEWYRRGFYDDGTPLGSAASDECRIDAIAQSWAVLSGGGEPERAVRAMAAVERELIRPGDGLALLFAPPFDHTVEEPGYIKGYPPGIRENGGQYTHAALWSVMALAALGQGDRVGGLLALLNPINHARTRAEVLRYKVEPYVVAADVYAVAPHVGRGGWSWYTGAAGWMQRAGIESLLGVRRKGAVLQLDPCIPKIWPGFELTLRHGAARYRIQVDNPAGVEHGVAFAALDEVVILERPLRLPLIDDGTSHQLKVRLG